MEDFNREFIASLIGKLLGEIVQLGAQKIVEAAVMVEFEVFLKQYSQVLDERGRPGIVKNGNHRKRTIMTSAGELKMKVPRVRDRREGVSDKAQFRSSVLPPYLRRAKELNRARDGLQKAKFVLVLGNETTAAHLFRRLSSLC